MVDTGEKLSVHRETTVEFLAGLRHETLSELPLEHDDGTTKDRTMKKKFKDKWTGDLQRWQARVKNEQIGIGSLTWYGRLATQRSKNGKSLFRMSPMTISSFALNGLQ